ncbi:MAG: glycosyltransferase [Thermoanaerobaculia bacterium]|nr:glycosyltransferase [Thermoanaerobaculia bacterium]
MDLSSSFPASAFLATYYGTLGVLALFGVHRLVLLLDWWRTRDAVPPRPDPPDRWPRVTVQLPLYNERFVAGRLLRAVARLDYPRDRLEIQVLDDSTDETREIVAARVEKLTRQGLDIHHLHRSDRRGYKAGALAEATEIARGELLCVFDADFVPPPDFLRRTVPHFQDPEIGMVQTRWGHLNREYSLLTRAQAVLLDGHFVIEHTARHRTGCLFNFNGTAGIWRRQAIEDAGGWQADTLTEDLDLSYRAQLAGWRFLYLPDLVVPSELPVDVNAFKSQQHRWARGSIQTARKLLPRLLGSPLPWRIRTEGTIHLTNNLSYPLMVLLSFLVFPAMVLRQGSEAWKILALDLPLFLGATISIAAFYAVSQVAIGRSWLETSRRLPAVMATGIGLSVHNTGAVLGGLLVDGGEFHRTPKHRIEGSRGRHPREYGLSRGSSFYVEGLFAGYFALCVVTAVGLDMWSALPFLYLFFQGYTYLFLLGLASRQRAPDPGRADSGLRPLLDP